jgi:hypothetical protein
MIKYKILGFSLITFLIIWLILLSRADSGYPKEMYSTMFIDSVMVLKSGKVLVIKSRNTIDSIVKILSNAKKFSGIDRTNINTDSYRIVFYASRSKNVFDISILYNVYNGKMAAYRSSFYNGDSIDHYINSIK